MRAIREQTANGRRPTTLYLTQGCTSDWIFAEDRTLEASRPAKCLSSRPLAAQWRRPSNAGPPPPSEADHHFLEAGLFVSSKSAIWCEIQ